MLKKIFAFFLLLNVTIEQSDLNIELLGGEKSLKCSNEIGKMEFSSEYTYSSQDELNSYFLLSFKDKSNQKRFSICQLSISKNSTQNENGTSQEEPKSSETDSTMIPTEKTSSPIEPVPSQSEPTPSQSGPTPSQSGSTPSQSGPTPSQSGPTPSQSGPTPSQSGPTPSQSGPSPSQSGPTPSQSGPTPSQTEPKPSQNATEPQEEENENEYDPDDIQLKALLEKERLKIEERLKKLLSNKDEFITIIKYATNIINYQILSQSEKINIQNIEEKFLAYLNSSLNKLFEFSSGNLTEKFINFNISEAKDTINATICSLKKKIVEIISKNQNLFQIINISQIIDGFSILFSEEKNKTEINEKIVNIIDSIMTKFNVYTIQSLENIEKIIKMNFNTTNMKEIIDNIKTKLENNTNLNNLKNISFNKINETLYNLPNIIQDKIDKKEPLIIFDKIVSYFNNSNFNDSIQKIISGFKNVENAIKNINATDILLRQKEAFNNMINIIKTKIISFNNTIINKIIEKIEESNNKIFQNLNEYKMPELIQNISNKFIELEILIKNIAQNISLDSINKIIMNSIDKINKANATEITNKILEQIELNKEIINFLKNETEFLITYKLNITGHIQDYIANNDELKSLIEKIKNNSLQIKSSLSTPEILKAIEDLKNYKEKIKQCLNDIKTEGQNKFNQTLYNLIDKIIKTNYTEIIDKISNANMQYRQKLNELKQTIKETNLDSIIPKIREMIINSMNSFNITEFSIIYYDCLSKINNIKTKILSSVNLEKLKEIKFSLSNIQDTINNITIQIKAKLNQSNITSALKEKLENIFELIKNKTNNFHKEEILGIILELKNRLKNTTFYPSLEPILNQIKANISEFISKFNKTQITEEFEKILSSIKNIEKIFNNQTELMEKIDNKMSQIDLADLIIKLNLSLTKVKYDIISEMKNTTKYEERKSEFKKNISNSLNMLKKLFNYTEIIKNINNSLINNYIGNQTLEKILNYINYLKILKNNINITGIVNTTKIKAILLDIKADIEKIPEKLKLEIHNINESLYNYENKFITNIIFDLNNLQKNIANTINKLKGAKIGDIKGIVAEFINQLKEDLKYKTKDINNLENSHFFALIEELNNTVIRAKTQIMTQIKNNEDFKPFLENLNNIQNLFKKLFEAINSLPIIASLKNSINSTLEKIYNIKLSDIKEYSEKSKSKIIEEINNIIKIKKLSQRIKYIMNKCYVENNKTQNIIGKIFNNTKINNKINQFISLIEKIENYFEEFKAQNGPEKYNEAKEYLDQKIKGINTKENLAKLNETLMQDFNDSLNIIKLIVKKYESLPDRNNKTQLTKRIIALLKEEKDKLNMTEQILENINPKIKEYLTQVSDLIISLKDKIELPDNMTEFLEIIKEKLNTTKNNIKNLIKDMKGKNISEIVKDLTEKTKSKYKESIKEGLKKILDSEKINNIRNNEKILKIVEKLNNNKIIGSQFAQQILNFTLFIKNLNATVHSNDDNSYDKIKENIRNCFQNMNLNISGIIKGIIENEMNTQEYKEIYTNIKTLIAEIKEEISKSIENLKNIFNSIKNANKARLRLLSINKRERKMEINNRRIDNTGSLICKFDGTFSEDEILTANPENINSFILKSNVDYNIVIKSGINISIDKDMDNNCKNNYIETVSKNIYYKNISYLRIEPTKKRFNFMIRVRILPTFRIPYFFYLMMRIRLIIRARNLRFLDTEEEVDTFCLLENDTDRDNALFNCSGFNDNINEKNANNEISLGNFTSDYIQLPENLAITNGQEDTKENTNAYGANFIRLSKSSGLTGGAIAGIVIACVAVLAIVMTIVICLRKNSNKPIPNTSESINNLQIRNFN